MGSSATEESCYDRKGLAIGGKLAPIIKRVSALKAAVDRGAGPRTRSTLEQSKKVLATLALISLLCACSSGWTSAEKQAVTDVCMNSWGGTESQCECVAEATESVYPSFADFSKSTFLSPELERALVRCGVGWKQ